MKKIEDTNKWKDILYPWIGRINIANCPYSPSDLQIQCYPYQYSNDIFFFTKIQKPILKCVWNYKRLQIAKIILRVVDNTLSDFKLYYKSLLIKRLW